MPDILKEIYAKKKVSLQEKKLRVPLEAMKDLAQSAPPVRDFKAALTRKDKINIIAEIKKASPSRGIISKDFDPVAIAKKYNENGAAALSVLTEEIYFKGTLSTIGLVKSAVPLPILRKDFLIDPYQIYESRYSGADAVLLIVSQLDSGTLNELIDLAHKLSISCLVEVHDNADLEKALQTPAEIIGINNRNLADLTVDLETAEKIIPLVPEGKVIVVESGISNAFDIKRYRAKGISNFLVGELLMRSSDIGATLWALQGVPRGQS